jgi:hypothetical protein
MIYSAHAVGEHRFGHGTRPTQAGRHSLAVDVAGYSRLMGADEEGTLAHGVNSRIVEPAIALTAIGADTEIGRATP